MIQPLPAPVPGGPVPTIADLVQVADIDTVVRLDGQGGRLGQLVLTGDVVRSLVNVLEAAASGTGAAFLVVGHFGSGKSHFLAAVGELLADPGGAALGGWDNRLRSLAGTLRPSLAVAVPLVDYRAEARLEDLVLNQAWKALGAPPRPVETDRRAAWEAVLEAAGERGLVLLIDELSEFLRAKQGPPLTEDLRFLQFLGEWAVGRPVIVMGALQESIEEVANVSQRELARIRDRYRPSLALSMRHVEDLVRGRLVHLRPGAEVWVEAAWLRNQAAFGPSTVTLDRFARCYPIHPQTLSVLEGLRFLLSQQRGVVDFICRQLAGDPAAGIDPWGGRPYREVVTPDAVYDHFRSRLAERVESARLAEAVVPYYERAVTELFGEEEDRVLALRAVKLLVLRAASPLEGPSTAAQLAAQLLCVVSEIDPDANVAYLETAILQPLASRGAYVVAGEGGTFGVELEANAAMVAEARQAQVRAELARADRRVVRTAVDLGSSTVLPLRLFAEVGLARRELMWHNTRRAVLVGLARLSDLTAVEAAEHVEVARASGAEVCLLVGELEPEEPEEELGARARSLAAPGRLLLWVPAAPTAEEVGTLMELHSRRFVLEAARAEGRTEPGGLVEVLERSRAADGARAREVLHRCYFGGRIVPASVEGEVDLPSLAGLPFERQLPSLVDPALVALHPRHREVAPKGELSGEHILRRLVTEALAQARIGGGPSTDTLRSLAQAYLAPLGLVRRGSGDGLVVAPDAARSPAVLEALRLVGSGEPRPTAEVMAELADGPVGLTEPESLLVLNACMTAGLVQTWRGRKRLTETFLSVTPSDRVGSGELLAPGIRAAVAGLAPITGAGPFDPWTVSVQRAAWEAARGWLGERRGEVAQVADGLDRLAQTPALAETAPAAVTADTELIASVVEAGGERLSPTEGLGRLVSAIPDPAAVVAAGRRVAAVARFFRDDIGKVEQAVAYATHPELVVPTDESRLAALRDETLSLARDVLRLAAEEGVSQLVAASRAFRSAYVEAYRAGHDRYHSAVSTKDVEGVRSSPAYVALARLSALNAVAVPDDRIKVDRALAAGAPAPCTRPIDLELAWKPHCSCGFALDQPPPRFDAASVLAMAARGVSQHLAELGRPENLLRLQEAAAELESMEQAELAGDLRRLLELTGSPSSASPVAVASVLSQPLGKVVGEILRGGQLVARRDLAALREDLIGRRYPKRRLLELLAAWVDPSGEVSPTGLVEVLDTGDASGPPGPATAGEWAASSGSAAGSAGSAGSGASPAGSAAGRAAGSAGSAGSAAGRTAGSVGGAPPSATVAFLAGHFPGLAQRLPQRQEADAFWLAAWWAGRPDPPAWLPQALTSEMDLLAAAASAGVSDRGARAELAELDRRIGPETMLGDQVAAALDLGPRPAAAVASALTDERLLRHPVRLEVEELLRRLIGDWPLVRRLEAIDPGAIAAAHALLEPDALAALDHLLAAAGHLATLQAETQGAGCRQLVEELYPARYAPLAGLLGTAELAAAAGGLISPELIDAFRAGAGRALGEVDRAFATHADAGFPGCTKLWEVGRTTLAPLLETHGRVAVLLVDAMRADVWLRVAPALAAACPGRSLAWSWAVVPRPTRTVEAVASLYQGRPVPAGGGAQSPAELGQPFVHLGYEAAALVGADRDHRTGDLVALWAAGPPISVAVATGLDEKLHRTSVEPVALLDEAVAGIRRRVLPSLAALPPGVPLVVLADHGFRQNLSWGQGPEGRYVHGGQSLEECVVPVAVLAPADSRKLD